MISSTPTITDAGKNLLLRAVIGEKIVFTRYKIGNGTDETTGTSAMVDLVNPIVEFPISEYIVENGFAKITGRFDSTYITTDFRWKETGLFCKGEDDTEVLFAYSNNGENAGMLKANSTDIVAEQTVSFIVAVGNAENVTAILSESAVYADKKVVDDHLNNEENPHKVTAEQVGLGKVPNVSTNEQMPTYTVPGNMENLQSGERMDTAFGKIAKAVSVIIGHLSNKKNPHGVTAEQISAAGKEHTHSVTDLISGVLGIARGGTGVTSYSALREKLGLGSDTGVLSIEDGGTGASDVEGALVNLCAARYSIGAHEGLNGAGETYACKLTFDFTPIVVFVASEDDGRIGVFINPCNQGFSIGGTLAQGGHISILNSAWDDEDFSLTWYFDTKNSTDTTAIEKQLNGTGNYLYFALGGN